MTDLLVYYVFFCMHSIKAGRLLSYQDYLLYSPEVLHKQQRLTFDNITESAFSQNETSNSHETTTDFDSKIGNLFKGEANRDVQENVALYQQESHYTAVSKSNLPSKSDLPLTSGQPGFLTEFYSHSRLHHISTAGQELKRYVQNLVDSHGSKTFSGREKLKCLVMRGDLQPTKDFSMDPAIRTCEKTRRAIMHLDMDCFFVSVGLRKHPELKGN